MKVLEALGVGMLYAQEQILWHKVGLKERGGLKLYNSREKKLNKFTPGEKRIMAVSICMPEYDFLTDRIITEAFLESILMVSYHAANPEREKELNDLNKRVENIQAIVRRLYTGERIDAKKYFLCRSSEVYNRFGLCYNFVKQ